MRDLTFARGFAAVIRGPASVSGPRRPLGQMFWVRSCDTSEQLSRLSACTGGYLRCEFTVHPAWAQAA